MITNQSILSVTLNEVSRSDGLLYVKAQCGKVSSIVYINDIGTRVICQNASHKVWKGSGKFFSSSKEAFDSYKSLEMKSIISKVDSLNS